jgi:hypothetical protein
MQALCERCYHVLGPDEKFFRLGHIIHVRPDGEPVFLFSYLHAYDETTGGCEGIDMSADAA